MDLSGYNGKVVDSITQIKIDGWWQVYVINDGDDEYKPIGNKILYYKGKFYDKSDNKPWKKEDVDSIGNMMHLYNIDGYPHAIAKLEKQLNNKKSDS